METSYLIQRLQKPTGRTIKGVLTDNFFSFGGGLVNGGMSKEGMAAIKDIFSFDYMGSSEFEFGAVPKALSGLVKSLNELRAWKLTVKFQHHSWKLHKNISGTAPIYIICRQQEAVDIARRIKAYAMDQCAKHENGHDVNTKERICLAENLTGDEMYSRNCGWLELDNGYMFFSDKDMFEKTCKLFGLEVKEMSGVETGGDDVKKSVGEVKETVQ